MAPTKVQIDLLDQFGFATDFRNLSDSDYFAILDKMEEELQSRGINGTGDGLNDYGELRRSVIVSLPDD